MSIAKGITRHGNWDEKPYHEQAPQKSTMAEIEVLFEGDLVGKASTRFLMQYPDDTHCHYCGYLLVDGALKGISGAGSYQAQHDKTVYYELNYQLA